MGGLVVIRFKRRDSFNADQFGLEDAFVCVRRGWNDLVWRSWWQSVSLKNTLVCSVVMWSAYDVCLKTVVSRNDISLLW